MDGDAFKADLDELDTTLDGLEATLEPLLKASVSATASKIPLLDKAKLYTLTTYAIESLLFSSIRLHGQDAKDHAVFKELARIKQYFDKIKAVEEAGVKPTTKLDKGAAQRMIKHGLAGNDRSEQKGATWAGSKRKFDDEEAKTAASGKSASTAMASSIDDLVDEGQKEASKAARKAERKASRTAKKSKVKA